MMTPVKSFRIKSRGWFEVMQHMARMAELHGGDRLDFAMRAYLWFAPFSIFRNPPVYRVMHWSDSDDS
jgi:hypothetical protein